jgi:hypothetical protein
VDQPLTIYDPAYWDRLTDEQVRQLQFGAMVGSEMWGHAKDVLEERERKRAQEDAIKASVSIPAMPKVNFSCVKSVKLRKIAERDWDECRRALNAECWKSVLILSGGILETVLLSLLMRRRKKARATVAGSKANPDITKWTLGKIIEVTIELGLLKPAISMLPSAMKDYRNLAHPGDEIREQIHFSEAEAKAAFHTLQSILNLSA